MEPFQTAATNIKDQINLIQDTVDIHFIKTSRYPYDCVNTRTCPPQPPDWNAFMYKRLNGKLAIGAVSGGYPIAARDKENRQAAFVSDICQASKLNGSIITGKTYYTDVAYNKVMVCLTDIGPDTPELSGPTLSKISDADCSSEGVKRLLGGGDFEYYYSSSAVDTANGQCEHRFYPYTLMKEMNFYLGNWWDDWKPSDNNLPGDRNNIIYSDYLVRIQRQCENANGFFRLKDLENPVCIFTLGDTNIQKKPVPETTSTATTNTVAASSAATTSSASTTTATTSGATTSGATTSGATTSGTSDTNIAIPIAIGVTTFVVGTSLVLLANQGLRTAIATPFRRA